MGTYCIDVYFSVSTEKRSTEEFVKFVSLKKSNKKHKYHERNHFSHLFVRSVAAKERPEH